MPQKNLHVLLCHYNKLLAHDTSSLLTHGVGGLIVFAQFLSDSNIKVSSLLEDFVSYFV